MRIAVTANYCWAGTPIDKEVIEVEDDLTSTEIDEIAYEIAMNMIMDRCGWNWSEVGQDERY